MAKKQKCPEFENHERWLVAWADLLTLLFALFVVLYSIANVEVEKLKKVSTSIQKAFGQDPDDSKGKDGAPKGNSRTDGIFTKVKGNTNRESLMTKNRREMAAIIAADTRKIEREIEDRLYGSRDTPARTQAPEDRVVFVNRDQDGIRITLLARKFFKPSQFKLDDDARDVLDGVAASVKGLGRVIRVEGHTDNIPFNLGGMTNWELSASRAAAVVRYFISRHQFPSNTIYPAGFADSHPVAANDSPANRSLNRRVDIKILYDKPSEYVAPDEASPSPEPAEGEAAESETKTP